MKLKEAAALCAGELRGADAAFEGLSTDTRTLVPGTLFCAIAGATFDGNEFLAAAERAGAAGALATRAAPSMPCVIVDDTVAALQRLAAHWRARFDPACIAITGSNGKTTVKEMVAGILARSGSVLATAGNLNNHIGVPLTVSRLESSHSRMVIELGANHPGEIAALARIVRPHVGVITVIAPAHLEGFGSVEGVAHAKGELIEALPGDGTAVVNGDGGFQTLWRRLAGDRRLLRFGFGEGMDIRAGHSARDRGSIVRLETPWGSTEVALALAGAHSALNAAAAAGAALALGVDLEQVASGLAAMRPVRGRLMPVAGKRGSRILDDTYNANPQSLRAALEVLSSARHPRWLVMGDMGELGPHADRMHRDAGELARASGVDRLWCTGELSRHAAEAFGAGAAHFASSPQLVEALLETLAPGTTVLVKGSRAAHMERVVDALTGEASAESRACC